MTIKSRLERESSTGRFVTKYSVERDKNSNGRKFTVRADDGPHKGESVKIVGISANHAYYRTQKKESA